MSFFTGTFSPSKLRQLTLDELNVLCTEAREIIIKTVNLNGGHLASNLGVVELTVALHRAFDSPRDRIVFDTSNQMYTHKLITGRYKDFKTLRKPGGISGFGEPSESEHDVMAAGHAGTALSFALGLALANQRARNNRYVIAVVGDGAVTAGMSFEAINNIVQQQPERLIFVLNDNGMSISKNIGLLTRWRDMIQSDPKYVKAVKTGKRITSKLPNGELILKLVRAAKHGVEEVALPSMLWEQIGFRYIGPVDGHDIRALEKAFANAKASSKPPIVHVLTEKGRGYAQAEVDPTRFHQPGSPIASGSLTYSSVFANTLKRIMENDEKVVGITAAMLDGTGLAEVKKRFPDRVYDTGVAEQHAVTMAAGLARGGTKPFVSIYSTFLQRAFDQIVHDVCLNDLGVVFCIDRAGIVGEDGKTHQGVFDVAYLRCIPNLTFAAPRDEEELQHLLYTAYSHTGPFAIRYPRGSAAGVPMDTDLRKLPIGQGELLRSGQDVMIIAVGSMVIPSLKAAEKLSKEGIECGVIDARFIKPLDGDLIIEHCKKAHLILTVEESLLNGGFGSSILELLGRAGVRRRVVTLGLPDEFIEHGTKSTVLQEYDLSEEGIAKQIRLALALAPGKVP